MAMRVWPLRITSVSMEQVLGVGGVFFKARDPVALAAWYRVPVEPGQTYGTLKFVAANEPTVFATFPSDTKYVDSASASFMINFRVRNLDALFEQLRAAGADVVRRIGEYDYGRFGWVTDPEGNRIELWEPTS